MPPCNRDIARHPSPRGESALTCRVVVSRELTRTCKSVLEVPVTIRTSVCTFLELIEVGNKIYIGNYVSEIPSDA